MENGRDFSMEHQSGSGSSSPTMNSSTSPSSEISDLKICFGCQQPIIDEFRLRVSPDLEWHASCLVCSECKVQLDETCTCFIKNGKTYCKKDYVRLFGISCTACKQPVNKSEYVMRARDQVYHMKCFSCIKCENALHPGEHFGIHEGQLYCKTDYNNVQQDKQNSTTDHSTVSNGDNSRRPSSSSSRGTKRSNSDKGPRVRTVLSEQQLQTLRTVYASNPRPDALLKEHLVEITQLSPRVIRVWFQNKRCKDKKKMIQAQEQARLHGQPQLGAGTTIPPITPNTPLTPDSISPHHSMSAFTYPPELTPISTQTSVSHIATYQHNPTYGSPTDTLAHFDVNVDYTSPSMTQVEPHQTYIHSSVASTTQVTPYF